MIQDLDLRPLKRGACRHLVAPAHAEFLIHAGAAKPHKWSAADRMAVENTTFHPDAVLTFHGFRIWRQEIEAAILDVEE
jgi:hypothetical protein